MFYTMTWLILLQISLDVAVPPGSENTEWQTSEEYRRDKDVRVEDDPHRMARAFEIARRTAAGLRPVFRAALRARRRRSSNSSIAGAAIDLRMTTSRSPTTTN